MENHDTTSQCLVDAKKLRLPPQFLPPPPPLRSLQVACGNSQPTRIWGPRTMRILEIFAGGAAAKD